MEDKKRLKSTLIWQFLLIMACIAVSEAVINLINDKILFPFLAHSLKWNAFDVSESGMTIVVSMILGMLINGVIMILPSMIARPFQDFVNIHWQEGVFCNIHKQFEGYSDSVIILYYIGCLTVMLLLLIILISPYIVGAVLYSRVIRKQLDILIAQDQRKHIEYEQKRSLMLSDIAHDLKTPIQTISGYSQALKDGVVPDNDKKQEYLGAIYRKSLRMNDLITLLFEYVKLDSTGFTLKKEKVDLAELLRENAALHYADFEKKCIEMDIDIPDIEYNVMADKLQMSRAVTNLISNALKHTGRGDKVLVRFSVNQYRDRCCITVADSGEAIPDNIAKHIFEPFVMGDASRNSGGGSGLGLSIAFKIVHMHGGRLILNRHSVEGYTKAFEIYMKS